MRESPVQIDQESKGRSASALKPLMVVLMLAGVAGCAILLWTTVARGELVLRPSARPVVMIAACYCVAMFLASVLWQRLLYRGVGARPTWRETIVGLAALMIGKYLPGKVLGLLGRAATVSAVATKGAASTVTVMEQGYAVGGLVVFSSAAAYAAEGTPMWAACLLVTTAVFLIGPRAAGVALRPLAARWSFADTSAKVIANLRWHDSCALLLVSSLGAAAIAATAYFATDLLGLDVNAADRWRLMVAYSCAIATGMLAFVLPGGIGAREAAFVLFAPPSLGAEAALAVASILRLAAVAADLAVGVIGLVILQKECPVTQRHRLR